VGETGKSTNGGEASKIRYRGRQDHQEIKSSRRPPTYPNSTAFGFRPGPALWRVGRARRGLSPTDRQLAATSRVGSLFICDHESMTQVQLFKKIGKRRTRNQKRLNDIHIWSSLAIIALRHSRSDDAVLNQREFAVPSSRRDKTVLRKPKKVRKILSGAVSRDLYSALLVYVAAQVEAYLTDIISVILQYDTRRLKTRVQGIEMVKSIDLTDVLNCESKEELVKSIIEQHLMSLFYAKPSLQFDYFSKVIGVEVKSNLKDARVD